MNSKPYSMSRILAFLYGLVAYAIGLGGLVYFILFLGSWEFLPRHINSDPIGQLGLAIGINLGVLLLFGVQHSVMARPVFKEKLTRFMPKAIERSTYILLSGVMMLLFSFFWQPINGTLWQVNHPIAEVVLTVGYLGGWGLAILSSFVINHFELFGLQQIYYNLINKPLPKAQFTKRFLYSFVRHPLQLGVLLGTWITPWMTATHMFLAIGLTVYILIGLYFEEKDLVRDLGDAYLAYKQEVPKLIPVPAFFRKAPTFDQHIGALTSATLKSKGVTDPALRQSVASYSTSLGKAELPKDGRIPTNLLPYLSNVAKHAYKITDADVERLKDLNYSEDEIFELTLSAAVGAGLARYESGLSLLDGIDG